MTLLLTLDDGSVQRKLADAVEFARAAVLEEAPGEQLGAHVGVTREDAVTASHLFEAQVPGYRGWRWSVTVALAADDEPVTVSEVVLVPGPEARIAPPWVPWERRVRAGDLGVGDIFPTDENDPRLAPAYLQSDDPAVEEVARDAGLGRVHVLSRFGRTEAASRWHTGEFGPRSDMARSAPDVCGTCGFFVPLAGSLRGVFGVCSNDISPADGHVVDVEYGCGAHSEVEVEVTSSIPVAELVYDDSLLDFTPVPSPSPSPEVVETAAAEPETAVAESDISPAEVEPEVAAPAESESAQAEVADAVAEPEVVAPAEPAQAGAVAEPAEVEPAEAETTDVVAEPEAVAPVEVDPAEAEVTDAAAEPEVVAAAEPAQAGAVAEPAEAAPVPAEVADAAAEPEVVAAVEPAQADAVAEPAEVESAQAEVADVVAEPAEVEAADVAVEPEVAAPVVDDVPEPAEAEPTQAEVTDAVAEPQAEAGEAVELPEAAVTDNVVTEAHVRDEGAGEQRER
ncbi:DUF3027 domain-containing protein [Amycolatopsis solani]|uniref:DUF3027 domain-containing protein n=1 Tax=Amycolatopsis solani TaxID=3028615 RepID=UPI003F68E681